MTTIKKRRTTQPPAVTVYVTPTCQNCPKTIHLLKMAGIQHTVVDLTQDKDAYRYVTQDLGYKQAPIIVVSDGATQTSWSGHHPELIQTNIINTTAANHAPGLSGRPGADTFNRTSHRPGVVGHMGEPGRVTGQHLHFQSTPDQDEEQPA